jgi:hypothetical protein
MRYSKQKNSKRLNSVFSVRSLFLCVKIKNDRLYRSTSKSILPNYNFIKLIEV